MSSETLPIKGQETKFSLSSPNGLEESVAKVKDATFTFDMELIQQQYLSEVADQFDDIFRGCSVDLTFDLTDPKVFTLVQAIIDRAQRRTPASGKFNVVSSLAFPTGRARLIFPNLKFAEIPTAFGGRDEYGEVKFSMKCSSFQRL